MRLLLQVIERRLATVLYSSPLIHLLDARTDAQKFTAVRQIKHTSLKANWISVLATFSSLLCQLSSLFTIRSIQCDRVAKMPAVVALNVMASPLKSMPLIPLGVRDWKTAKNDANKADEDLKRRLTPSNSVAVVAVSSLRAALIFHDSRFSLLPLPCRNSPSVRVLGKSSSSSSTTERHRQTVSNAATHDPAPAGPD